MTSTAPPCPPDSPDNPQEDTMFHAEPLPLDILKTGLEDIYQEKYECSLSIQVHICLEQCAAAAGTVGSQRSQESQRAEELLRFAKSKKYEKMLRVGCPPVPDFVLPDGCSAVLYDIKIHGKGPDDTIYRREEQIRTMIPRGTSILEWKNSKNKENWSSVVIYGHKKFTGGIGDEDEEQPENNDIWQLYFIKNPGTVKRVVCMEKLNGEAAHVAGRYIDGQFYFIVGSKNVHMIIREKSHIDLYEGGKYEYAKVIAKSVWDTFASLDQQRQHLLRSLLHHTKCTLVGEILQPQNQHIVNLSHLKKPEVGFISMTSTYIGSKQDTLMAMPPHHFLDLCTALGLNTAAYTVVEEKNIMARKEEIRRGRNTEGEVFYYLDKDENTIGIVKVKTTWYTLLRALREKSVYTFTAGKKKLSWSLEEYIGKTHKRFQEIQVWLRFSDAYLRKWKNLAEKFLRWLNSEIKEGTKKPAAIRPCFPVLWNEFLRTNNETDEIELR